ncbi:MAG: hypothetical protein KJ623_00405 [Nanoarchaeota archaeon]|nr:hypothetical protein [Nanoarchaeota archaeon]MBU0962419.1 hypothetical protein [Nanoarchaeota archaeon]
MKEETISLYPISKRTIKTSPFKKALGIGVLVLSIAGAGTLCTAYNPFRNDIESVSPKGIVTNYPGLFGYNQHKEVYSSDTKSYGIDIDNDNKVDIIEIREGDSVKRTEVRNEKLPKYKQEIVDELNKILGDGQK